MNDTLDSFDFSLLPSQIEKNDDKVCKDKDEISFDDTAFLTEFSNISVSDSTEFDDIKNSENNDSFMIKSAELKLTSEELKRLSKWNLPRPVLEQYKLKNLTEMFPWQVQCLSNKKVLEEHKNLIYSAPTSAGKTLVAEILAIKTIFERRKKVIFVLPFVSIVREKTLHFQDLLNITGVRVEGFMGGHNPPGGFDTIQMAICTIEKANNLINRLMEEDKLNEIGAVLIDEMHLLSDPHRGYLLELLLTKLKFCSVKNSEMDSMQIIGMSATLPNLNTLSEWLNAELFVTDFRPIPLHEHMLISGTVYDKNIKFLRELSRLDGISNDKDNVLQLCLETLKDSCSVLIFCPTKNWCESLAQQISTAFFKIGSSHSNWSTTLRDQLKPNLIMELLEQLKFSPVGLDDVLKRTVSFGVAFHHAGLTTDERVIIENGFKNGALRVLVATSTLSSGVNLPARRVIIRTPIFHGKPLDVLVYKQMIGRAGRMGKDVVGESFLVCQKAEYQTAKNLITSTLTPAGSCLAGEGKLERAILEIVASGVASTPEDLNIFIQCTLLSYENCQRKNEDNKATFKNPINEAVNFLINNEFILLEKCGKYTATSLAKACLSSSIAPEEGLALFGELERARQCFVLETELHLIYLVTPYSACYTWGEIDWMSYLNLYEKLPKSMKKVAELIGIKESYLINATRGKCDKSYKKTLIHKRFFIALALQDLVNEKPITEVCFKFHCNRGALQSLQHSAATFAGMVTAFSKKLGWSCVELLIGQFQDRLQFGVARELLDLMKIDVITGKVARILFNAGLETVAQLANSNVADVKDILRKSVPFESEKLKEGQKLKKCWINGREGLTESDAAEILIFQARKFIQLEMGLVEAKWKVQDLNCSKDSAIEEHLNSRVSEISNLLTSPSLAELNISESSDSSVSLNLKNFSESNNNQQSAMSDDIFATSDEEEGNEFIETKKRKTPNSFCETPTKKHKSEMDFNQIHIVNVDHDVSLIHCLEKDVKFKQSIAISCAVNKSNRSNNNSLCYNGYNIEGVAITWGKNVVYYLRLIDVNLKDKIIRLIQNIMKNKLVTMKMFKCKTVINMLYTWFSNKFNAKIEDPMVADWLLDPDGKEKNLELMAVKYCPETAKLSYKIENCQDIKIRACLEAVLTWHITESVKSHLGQDYLNIFENEMGVMKCLARMEYNGFGVKHELLQKLIIELKNLMQSIETSAYSMVGRRFNFLSSGEVLKILGMFNNGKKVSARKKILEQNQHPLSNLILQWRKIDCTLKKSIYPITRNIINDRIYGICLTHTSTGRIMMQEPNVQNVAKNFTVTDAVDGKIVEIRCRDCFEVGTNSDFCLISADYCQLELRILAHFSQDEFLLDAMRKPGDVFRSIAAKWNCIAESEVTDQMRQNTKQLCYGIIYGMGAKALSETLEINENEATIFMETFQHTYPGIRTFIQRTIEKCKRLGYAETISGRKRYLVYINDADISKKCQAERQAVNTTIQGTGADIVKRAMVRVEDELDRVFEKTQNKPKLVLHLHDEIIYEVPMKYKKKTGKIIKNNMENVIDLSVPFPVKLKCGKSWGDLTEYHL